MKQNIILYIIISVLLIFNSILILQKTTTKQSTIKKEVEAAKNDKLTTIINVMVENQNVLINKNQNIINETFDTLSFFELINSPKLIFYFNEYSCMPCVEELIQLLNTKVESFGKDNIIILSHYEQLRNMYIFSHINKLKIPIYNLTEPLKIPIASKNIPFLFTIDQKLAINNLFLVDKSLYEHTRRYISIIEKTVFQTELNKK